VRRWLPGGKARLAAFIAGLALALWLGLAIGPSAVGLYGLVFPADSNTAWDSKVGWRLCNRAIADWPGKPAAECWKLALCDNEGGLSDAERLRLKQMIAAARCEDR
jgi:hypothetical protein